MRQTLLILALFALACSSPAKKTEKARDELQSWAATGAVLAKQWSEHRLPRAYATSSIDVANESLMSLTEPLGSHEHLRSELLRVAYAYDALSTAVRIDDRAMAAAVASELDDISSGLKEQR